MIRGESKAIDRAKIECRQPVWAALSELWLDTELSEENLGRIVGVMKGRFPTDPGFAEAPRSREPLLDR